MNALALLARDKELLLARSALCRLRLRNDASALRESLSWRRMAIATASSPGPRGALLGLVFSLPALARLARFAVAAVRIATVARLVLSLAGHARSLARTATRPVR